jgi:hypothetical protein
MRLSILPIGVESISDCVYSADGSRFCSAGLLAGVPNERSMLVGVVDRL